ncbi:SCO family protein [Sporosarcina sp. PTS2304]|uniref:SCO family protein n=1 Tax=Sporosarcina sp. PTS2304 TaxID=2283194 RepID=UPI001F076020|nr:SCO family protein [Sporosarcina sp. PTS2304]
MERLIPLLFALLIITAGCSEPLERGKQVRDFTFIDQNSHSFGKEQVVGTPWIANFVFTNCTTICPTLTSEMAGLQELLKQQGLNVQFVSFSVDPEVDSPEVLKEYIAKFTDDENNWHLLTGYTQQEIEAFAREEFQTFVLKHDSSTQVVHGTNFYLLDREGFIRKEYNFSNESYQKELLADLKQLN